MASYANVYRSMTWAEIASDKARRAVMANDYADYKAKKADNHAAYTEAYRNLAWLIGTGRLGGHACKVLSNANLNQHKAINRKTVGVPADELAGVIWQFIDRIDKNAD